MAANYSNSSETKSLGAQLRAARLMANLTLAQVGLIVGMSHSQISRIERGDFKNPSANVQKLCKNFNIDWRGSPSSRDKVSLASRLDRAANMSPQWAKVFIAFLDTLEMAQNFKT